MVFFLFFKTLLHTDWISWILHFGIFYTLSRWSGIKWQWALVLVFGIEVWETVDWALEYPMRWWVRLDTWLDITAGCIAIGIAEWEKR